MTLCNSWESLWVWMTFKSIQVSTTVWCHLVVLVRFNLNINRFLALGVIRVSRTVSVIPWVFLLIAHISRPKWERPEQNTGAPGPTSVSRLFLSLGCLLFTHLHCSSTPTTPLFPSTEGKHSSFPRLRTGCGMKTEVYLQSYVKNFIIIRLIIGAVNCIFSIQTPDLQW